MTDPATPPDVPEADWAEQEALVDPPAVTSAGSPLQPVGDREADEADVLEQEIDVPVDDEEPS